MFQERRRENGSATAVTDAVAYNGFGYRATSFRYPPPRLEIDDQLESPYDSPMGSPVDFAEAEEQQPRSRWSAATVRPAEKANGEEQRQRTLGHKKNMNKWRSAVRTVGSNQMREMANEAVLCLKDAAEGRLEHGHAKMRQKSELHFRFFKWQISNVWLYTILAANHLHCCLTLWEDEGRWQFWVSRTLSWIFTSVYLWDVIMKCYYHGIWEYMDKGWQRYYLFTCMTLMLSETAPAASHWRFVAIVMRPLISCFRVRVIRRFFDSIIDAIPGSRRILWPMLVVVFLSTMFVFTMAGETAVEDSAAADPDAALLASPLEVAAKLWGLMLNPGSCAEVIELVKRRGHGTILVSFVFLFIVVGHVFLLSLLIGVTYDVFVANTQKRLESDRQKELKGIVKAFSVMDPCGTGTLSLDQWHKFTESLFGTSCPKLQSIFYYHLLAHEPDNLDIIDFLHVFEVLNYDVHVQGQTEMNSEIIFSINSRESFGSVGIWLSTLTVLVDCLLWFLYQYDTSSSDVAGILFVLTAILLAGWAVEAVGFLGNVFGRWSAFQKCWVAGLSCAAMLMVLTDSHPLSSFDLRPIYKAPRRPLQLLSFVGVFLRCIRVFHISDVLMDHVHGFLVLAPALYYSAFSSTVVIYMFSQICHNVFKNMGIEVCGFQSRSVAMMTGAQIFFGADVEGVLANVSTSVLNSMLADNRSRVMAMATNFAIQLFIRTYHTFATLIMLNLVTAAVMNFYTDTMRELSETSRRQQVEEEEQLCKELVERLTKETVVKLWKQEINSVFESIPIQEQIDFSKISIHRRSKPIVEASNDKVMRAKLSGFSRHSRMEITDKQLRGCNKYAPKGIDLVEMAQDRKRIWSLTPDA